jgi:hypothetical protein
MPCTEYQQLKLRYEAAQNEHAQYASLPKSEVLGAVSVRQAIKLKIKARVQWDAAIKRMFDHRANCPICKSEDA